MRIRFSNMKRPKAAAKQLVQVNPSVKLSTAQEAVASAAGYRDWHELSVSLEDTESGDLPASPLIHLISRLGSDLGMLFGDVQYALTKARFIENLLTLEMQFGLRARAFREFVFGEAGRGKPGTVVKSKARSLSGQIKAGSMGYLLPKTDRYRQVLRVLFRDGICSLADFEVATPRTQLPDFLPARLWLPYGYWTLHDASIVIYNRDYLPLWHVSSTGNITRPEPWYWINGINQNFNFSEHSGTSGIWSSGRAHDSAVCFLRNHRVLGLPRTVEAFPYLFEPGVESVKYAVQLLQERWRHQGDVPSYASERSQF